MPARPVSAKTSDPAPAKSRGRGRPRDETVRQSIMESAHGLLQERGLRGFTIEEVAARSGAAKTTIYRAWPNRGVLAVESFLWAMAPRLAYPDVPSAIDSVRRQLLLVVRAFRGSAGVTMSGLIAEAQLDPQTAKFLLERYVLPRRAEAARVLRQGIEQGELRPDLDLDIAIDLLYGPLYYRLLVKHRPLDATFIDKVLEGALHGIAGPGKARRQASRQPRP